jgi:hypothetical protein
MSKLAFIDLDETLIHTAVFADYSDANMKIISGMVSEGCLLQAFVCPHVTKIRPKAHEFIKSVSEKYPTYLFTNANDHYARAILEFFDFNKYFLDAFTRQTSHTIIERIGMDKLHVDGQPNFVLVDDAPFNSPWCTEKLAKLGSQPIKSAYIQVKPYENEGEDDELLRIII